MDHWREPSARGLVTQYASRQHMDRFIKQLAALGFEGLDTFFFSLPAFEAMFGSLRNFEEFIRERGMQKVVNIFFAKPNVAPGWAFHDRGDHDAIVDFCERLMDRCSPLALEGLIVMPTNTYWQVEPVTDDKLCALADLWNRIGEVTRKRGIKTSIHHEFWCGIRTMEQIDRFYELTDPERVFFFCDAAQHVIAGVDPVAVYEKYHARCSGFHFKDTHDIDTKDEYRMPPDAELLAPSVERWFWEMGTPGGLVDFPAIMRALKKHNYQGWLALEHDKADIGGSNYAEATAVAKWYADNVLAQIYR
jgi:sugar phosphate isomerase/epimerase